MDFTSMSISDLTAALASPSDLSNDDLTAAIANGRERAAALFANETPTIEQADEAVALAASIQTAEGVQAERAAAVTAAAERFAAARATFSAQPEEGEEETEEDAEESEEEDAEENEGGEPEEGEAEGTPPETVTASASGGVNHTTSQTITASAARKVARKVKRPAVAAAAPVTITAAADIPNVGAGTRLADMTAVASAAQARTKSFPAFNLRAAETIASQTGGAESLQKFAVASFGVNFDEKAQPSAKSSSDDYSAVQFVTKDHQERVKAGISETLVGKPLTAAGWCAPSPVVYNWIADYVVDGLVTVPEVSAPRGGLMITQGPQLAQTTYTNLDDFGFGGTEAQAIAGYTKTCETIECPDFEDHRLDFTGYCWKIPILTEKAYPELVADALRLSNVLYAHKMNKRKIADMVALSTAVNATNALGGSMLDTLEAFTQVAIKERRWWNIGENAAMEIKLPQIARDIFKFDMARRSGLALNDIATDQKVAAHFANHNFSVEYASDWQETQSAATPTAAWPDTIKGLIYPAGTFVAAVEDVINLSAVYDAASLSQNEYTGVFFEQGYMLFKQGYRSHVVEVPVCVAGMTGANALVCDGSL